MAILDFLSPALTTATEAAGAYQGAKADALQQGRERSVAEAIQALKLKKEAENDAIMNRLRAAQTSRALQPVADPAKIHAANREYDIRNPLPVPQSRTIDPLSAEGIKAAADRAGKVAAAEAPYRRDPNAAAPRLMPSSAVEKITSIDNMLTMATDVRNAMREALETKTDATGRMLGVIPTPSWFKNMSGKGGDKGKDVRALVGNLYGTVAKERGGTALSLNELRLLESYLPNENEPEQTALIKANRFITTLKKMRANKVKAYEQYGYGKGGIVDDEAPMIDQVTAPRGNPWRDE